MKVILIGGAPGIGKSALARSIAAQLSWDHISTDDIGVAVGAVTSAKSRPGLHDMDGHDYRDYYASQPVDRMLEIANLAHEELWPAIEAVIRKHETWSTPAVIEGWALRPSCIANLDLPNVKSIWLTADETTLEQRIRSNSEFYRGAADEDAMIRNFLDRSVRFNDLVSADARRCGLPTLEVAANQTPQAVAEASLELLKDG